MIFLKIYLIMILEFRIQELESRFSKDMSETTFNELKELKNERKIN